jgi:hypothetical protein
VTHRLAVEIFVGERSKEGSTSLGRDANTPVEHFHGDPLGADFRHAPENRKPILYRGP